MTETYHEAGQYSRRQQQQHRRESRGHQMIKAATAATAGGLLLIMSGLTLAATVIALTVATPVLVIFSPVLVPAMMTVFFLVTGLLASGGFGVAGVTVLGWMYRYVSSGRERDGGGYDRKVQVWRGREREEHGGKGHHATGGVRMTTGARTGLFQQG